MIQGMNLDALASPLDDEDDEPSASTSLTRAVRDAVEALPPVDRTLIIRRLEAPDLTYTQLGLEMDMSEGATRVRHHRALKRLTERLAARSGDRRLASQERPRRGESCPMSNPILPPDSVQALLTLAYPSARFQADCRTAALRARSHGRLRQAVDRSRQSRETSGSSSEPSRTRLARSDQEVAEFSGLDPDHPVDAPFAAAWGRFAAAVGLAWDQAELALGISLLEDAAFNPGSAR